MLMVVCTHMSLFALHAEHLIVRVWLRGHASSASLCHILSYIIGEVYHILVFFLHSAPTALMTAILSRYKLSMYRESGTDIDADWMIISMKPGWLLKMRGQALSEFIHDVVALNPHIQSREGMFKYYNAITRPTSNDLRKDPLLKVEV